MSLGFFTLPVTVLSPTPTAPTPSAALFLEDAAAVATCAAVAAADCSLGRLRLEAPTPNWPTPLLLELVLPRQCCLQRQRWPSAASEGSHSAHCVQTSPTSAKDRMPMTGSCGASGDTSPFLKLCCFVPMIFAVFCPCAVSCTSNFPEPPTPGIFSKASPVQMGGVLWYS